MNLPLNGWNDYRDRSSGPGNMSPEKYFWFTHKRFHEGMVRPGEELFNSLPHHTQMQIRLNIVRKQLENNAFQTL